MKLIEEQIREIFVKIIWTHKIQEKAADIDQANHKNIKLLQIFASASTTGVILASIIGKSELYAIISAVLSAIVVALETYTKGVDFAQKSMLHAKTAESLRNVRESYFSLITDMKSNDMDYDTIAQRRDQLKIQYDAILSDAPRTGPLARRRATEALSKDKDHSFTYDELNRYLPPGFTE